LRCHASLVLLSLLLLIFVQVVSHPVSGAATFQSPAPLTVVNGTDRLPTSTRLSNGQLWVAWEAISLSSQTSIVYETYNGIWSAVQTVASGPGSVSNIAPTLAQLQNGTVILVWSGNQTGHFNLYYKLNNNGVWSGSTRLTSTSSDDSVAKAVVSTNSTLWVFWQRDGLSSSCISGACHQVFYKTLKGNQWSSDVAFTTNSFWSAMPGPMVTNDNRVWLSWSSTSSANTGFSILYSIYNGQWSSTLALTSTATTDTHPALAADRNGTIWLLFTRDVVLSNGVNGVTENDLFYTSSGNVGSTWAAVAQLTVGGTVSNPVDSMDPSVVQGADELLWIFYSTDITGGGSSFDIYYIRSYPILTHDVALSKIQYPPFEYPGGFRSVGESAVVKINATITNTGDFVESITVNAVVSNVTSYNLGTVTASLAVGQSLFLTFPWNTTGVTPAKYSLSVTVTDPSEPVLNSYNDSAYYKGGVRLVPIGDVDQDGSVTIVDVGVVFYNYGFAATCNCSRWNPYADINGNGIIDIVDVGVVSRNYGTYA